MDLTLSSVTKHYGDVRAVNGVSFALTSGERLSLLGPSGCGKTTLLNAIAGFADISSGTIRMGDRDISRIPPFKRNIGIVFQNYALFPHLDVEENLYFGLKMRGVSRQDARQAIGEALEIVRLEPFRKRYPHQLSGGQQQRVAVARAIVIRPQILLLDEPLSNLDAKLRHEMRTDLLRILDDLSITTIMVTHDQAEALSLAHRVAVLNQGAVEQIDEPEALYERPATHFVAGFLGESNRFDATLAGIEGGFAKIVLAGGGEWRGRATGSTAANGPVAVFVRTERIGIGVADAATDNGISGTVRTVIYLGEERRLVVDTSAGEMVVKLSARDRVEAGAGDAVSLHWSAQDTIILPGGSR